MNATPILLLVSWMSLMIFITAIAYLVIKAKSKGSISAKQGRLSSRGMPVSFMIALITLCLVCTGCGFPPTSTPTLTPVPRSTLVPSQTPTSIPPLEGKIIFSVAGISGSDLNAVTAKYYIYDLSNNKKSEIMDFSCGIGLSSDQRKLAFFNTKMTLIQMDIQTGETRELLSLDSKTNTCGAIAWSPDDSKIAHISNGDLYVLQVDSGVTTLVAGHQEGDYSIPIAPEFLGIRNPIWTRDGNTILFDDFTAPFIYYSPPGPGGYRAIYAVSSIDNGLTYSLPLGLHDGEIVSPVPNKQALVVRVYRDPANSSESILRIINEDGTDYNEQKALSDLLHAWSSDGNEIAYVDNKIFVVDISSRERRDLRYVSQDVQDITWSPDNNHLAIIETISGSFELYAIDAVSSYATIIDKTRVPSENSFATILAWIEP